jgi:hypothetical protein
VAEPAGSAKAISFIAGVPGPMSCSLKKFLVLLMLAVLCCATTGCVRSMVDGSAATFSFDWWIPALVVVGGAAAFLLGLALVKSFARIGLTLIFLGPLSIFVLAPSVCRDQITVDPVQFTLRTGFWFKPTVRNVPFNAVSKLVLVRREQRQLLWTSYRYFIECHLRSGYWEQVPVSDLMKRGPAEIILHTAESHGIPIANHWHFPIDHPKFN